MADRKIPEINAGSMADIAFLLLVFFLVTTTIQTDSGILVTLPPYVENTEDIKKVNERNVYDILVNSQDQVLAREIPIADLSMIKDNIKEFIMNPSGRADYAERPTFAVVSLRNDNGTSYNTYIEVYNNIRAAYNELWEEKSQNVYGQPYVTLAKGQQKAVRDQIPLVISEAEPTDVGS